MLLDRSAKKPLVMFSVEGGVDIEEVAEKTPEKLIRHHVDPLDGTLARGGACRSPRDGGADADVVEGVADALVALYEVWLEEDATLAEINPLIVTPEREVRALDSKVSLDGNALFRHPENQELSDSENEDPLERRAKEEGVQYVKLDGDIGILGNGAGLVMSTLDVVAQARRRARQLPRRRRRLERREDPRRVELILANDEVKAVLFNIFGGITRCDEVAEGPDRRLRPARRAGKSIPFVVRLDGTNDVEGRRLLQEAALPNVYPAATMNEAAEKVVALASGARRGAGLMSVLVDERTRLCVAGITGREGSFHTLNNRNYGTNVVGGVTPGKGGQDVEGIPVFDSWEQAAAEVQPNTAMKQGTN